MLDGDPLTRHGKGPTSAVKLEEVAAGITEYENALGMISLTTRVGSSEKLLTIHISLLLSLNV